MGDDAKADSYGFTTTERGGRRRKPLPHCGCTVPCQRSFTCPMCQHVRPWCFGAGDSDECDACWGEQERADALTTARAEGYAEGVADVVAMMRDHVRRAENVMRKSHYDRGPFDASTLQAGSYVRGAAWGIDQIDSGAHVGAAKKGGAP